MVTIEEFYNDVGEIHYDFVSNECIKSQILSSK